MTPRARRPFDLVQAVAGLLCVGTAVATLGDDGLGWRAWTWLGPVVLVVLGLAALAPVLRRH